MDVINQFDVEKYFEGLCRSNRMARQKGFIFCTCSGIETIQGPLEHYRTGKAFLCVDDTNDGSLVRGKGGGWFQQRTITVFLLHRYEFQDEKKRAEALNACRELKRQLVTRLILDAGKLDSDLIYLHTENILCRELGQYFLNGCTGLYFMLDVSEPVDLKYNSGDWDE